MSESWALCRIGKSYRFSSAHYLPRVPEGHKCKRLHGHNYIVEVELRGELGAPNGPKAGFCCGIDFFDIDGQMLPLIEKLDHRLLNAVPGLENPTAENIAIWFLKSFDRKDFFSVKVWEEADCWAQAINSDGLFKRQHKE